MWHLSVTIPAGLALPHLCHHVIHLAGIHHGGVETGMTADAIVHDYLTALFSGTWSLAFCMRHPHGHMLHSVHALESILASYVLVWHVAVITSGITRMAGVEPGGVIRRHDVTVHASRRIIAQIAVCTQYIKEEDSASHQTA